MLDSHVENSVQILCIDFAYHSKILGSRVTAPKEWAAQTRTQWCLLFWREKLQSSSTQPSSMLRKETAFTYHLRYHSNLLLISTYNFSYFRITTILLTRRPEKPSFHWYSSNMMDLSPQFSPATHRKLYSDHKIQHKS